VRPGRGRRCARASPLTARAVRLRLGLPPSQLALRACSSGFALATRAARSQLVIQIVHLNPITNPTPPRTHPNWLGQPGVTLKVGAAGCTLTVGAAGDTTLYEFVLYNSHKHCMNWYKNQTVYEFVLYNLYNNCMNSFVRIRTKISEKNCFQVGISTRDQYRACNRRRVCHSPPHLLRQWPFYVYTVQLRKPSKKRDCTIPDN